MFWFQLTSRDVLLANIQHGIVQSPAHQKLQAQVVNALGIGIRLALLGTVPFENEAVAEGQAGGGVGGCLIAVKHATGQRGLDVAHNLTLESIFVLKAAGLMLQPGLSLGFRDGSCSKDVISGLSWSDVIPRSGV